MSRRLMACIVASLTVTVWVGRSLAEDTEAAPPKLEPTKEQARTDALAIQSLHQKHAEAFRGIEGGVSVHETTVAGTLKLCEESLAKLQNLEQNALPEIGPVLARVTALWAKPGAEEAARAKPDFDDAQFAFQQSGEIEWNMKMAAAGNDISAARDLPAEFDGLGTRYSDLARLLSNLRKTRVANAAYLVTDVKDQPEITFFVQDKRVAMMTEWKTLLEWALKFDPTDAYANTRLATIGAEIASLQQAVEKEIDEKEWAGQLADFAGPGSVAKLSQVAMEFLRKDKKWGNQGDDPEKNEDGTVRQGVAIVAVVVRGPWQVAETDLFGRVLSWRLPIHVAVTKPDLKARNIARVYELSMVTRQGAPYRVAKAPPFDGCWVGDSWMMRLSNVTLAQ
jgi:hypothetical protein